MDSLEEQFDRMYRETEGRRFSSKPGPYIRMLPGLQENVQGLQALDIGGGEGQNSIYLAKHGYSCLSTDISGEAVKRAAAYAWRSKVKIDVAKLNIVEDEIPGTYDLVIMARVMHNLTPTNRQLALKKIMRAMNGNGISFLSFYTERQGRADAGPIEAEILGAYQREGWEQLKLFRRGTKLQKGEPARITTFIARKIR